MHNILHYHSKQIFSLFIGREPTTWPANNWLQIKVCSCAIMSSYCVWLHIIFCLCMKETTLFSFLRSLFRENGSFLKIFIKKQTWSLNDKTILLNLVIEKYHDLSVSRRSIICLSLWFSANNSPFYSYNTGGNEAGVDLVLIQPFLLYYVNLSCSFAN